MVKSVEFKVELILTKKMESDNKEKIYSDDDDECHICDKLAIDRYYNNHPKSQTHMNNFRKRTI